MRFIPLFFLLVFLRSYTENKRVSIKSESVIKEGEHQVSQNKKEQELDSIRKGDYFGRQKVIKNAPIIDPQKINGAFLNTLDFNKVIAYSYDGSHEQTRILNSTTVDQQIALNQDQANTILSLLARKNTFDTYASMGCFEPRFALVLYKDNSFITQISICMDCNNLHYNPMINGIEGGLSKKGRKGIISFCKELKFPYGELKN